MYKLDPEDPKVIEIILPLKSCSERIPIYKEMKERAFDVVEKNELQYKISTKATTEEYHLESAGRQYAPTPTTGRGAVRGPHEAGKPHASRSLGGDSAECMYCSAERGTLAVSTKRE